MAAREATATEPRRIAIGEKLNWTREWADYPATEYSLEYRFRGNGTGFNVTATVDGNAFDATITAAQSAAMTAGEKYQWQAWLTNQSDANDTWIVDRGTITVERGFVTGTTTAIDLRSEAKQILDAINATILNKATADQLEYEIATPAGSRKLKRMALKDLMEAKKEYARIVRMERAAENVRNGGKFGRTVVGRLKEV